MAEAVLRSNVSFFGPGPGGPGAGGPGPGPGRGGPPGGGRMGSGGIGTGGFMGRAFTFAAFHPHASGGDGGNNKDPKKPSLLDRIGEWLVDIFG